MRRLFCALLICAALPLAGCWDMTEVDEQIYVINIAIDKADDGIMLTTQMSSLTQEGNMSMDSGSDSGSDNGEDSDKPKDKEQKADKQAASMSKGGAILATTYGRTLAEARDIMRASTPRIINARTIKYIVISEEIARDEGFGDLLEQLWRIPRIKNTAYVLICNGEALDFLKNLTPFAGSHLVKSEESAVFFLNNISYISGVKFVDLYRDFTSPYCTAYAVTCGVNDFTNDTASGHAGDSAAGALPRKGTNRTELFGAALFDEKHMVTTVTGYENQLLDMVRGGFTYGTFEVGEGKDIINVTLSQARGPSVTASPDGSSINVDIWLEGACDRPRLILSDVEPLCESALKYDIEKLLTELTEKRLDPCRFGEDFAWRFSTIEEFEAYDYLEKLTPDNIHVNVRVTLHETPYK